MKEEELFSSSHTLFRKRGSTERGGSRPMCSDWSFFSMHLPIRQLLRERIDILGMASLFFMWEALPISLLRSIEVGYCMLSMFNPKLQPPLHQSLAWWIRCFQSTSLKIFHNQWQAQISQVGSYLGSSGILTLKLWCRGTIYYHRPQYCCGQIMGHLLD